MTIWIAIAALTVITVAIIALPMLKAGKAKADRVDYDIELFKEQLKELEREHQGGLLNDDQLEAARQELQRRLLAADAERQKNGGGQPEKINPLVMGGSLFAVSAATLALYLALGKPELPDFPMAQRNIEQEQNEQAGAELQRMLGALEARLKENPNDLKGWRMLARSYQAMERFADAAEAFAKAAELAEADSETYSVILTNFAESRLFASQGKPDAEVRSAVETAKQQDPLNMKAWFYGAYLKSESGDLKGALQDWVDMRAVAAQDAPWLEQVETEIAEAAQTLGLDPASLTPTPGVVEKINRLAEAASAKQAETAPAGPTAEQMRDAAAMSADDRAEMIRSMVERLAARLEENPDDKEGWLRLANAYRVLGETAKAEEAERRAKGDSRKTSVTMPAGVSEGLKQQIADLRAKLDSNPQDLESWQTLGRTLLSMGEAGQAIPVFAKAVELKPQDKDVLTEYASAILSATPEGGKFPPEFVEAVKKIEAIDANDSNVLWYLGLAAQQSGDKEQALAYWNKLLAMLKPDTVPYAKLKAQIDALK